MTIDGDLQDDPAEIPRLLAKLEEGFDLVSGWKTQRRDPLPRRIPSRIFNRVAGWMSGLRLHDMNCGLKAYRAEVVRSLGSTASCTASSRCSRTSRVPDRRAARPPSPARARAFALRARALPPRLPRPAHRLVHGPVPPPAAASLRRARPAARLLGDALLVYLTIDKLLGHAIGKRPLLTLGVLLVVVGMQFFTLGLISEMITSHHEERAVAREQRDVHVEEVLP